MEDQFTKDVYRLKGEGKSERKIAAELKVSRSKVHGVLEKVKQEEESNTQVRRISSVPSSGKS